MRAHLFLCALAISCLGCDHEGSSPPIVDDELWQGSDGWSSGDAPFIYNEAHGRELLPLGAAQLVAWPELEVVESTSTREIVEPLGTEVIRLVPTLPLDARWYAVRVAPPDDDRVTLDGIPLTDGSAVWRFHGAHVPQLRSVDPADPTDPGKVTLHFGEDIFTAPRPGVAAIRVSQGETTCEVLCREELWGMRPWRVPCVIDPAAAIRIEIIEDTLRSVDGAPVAPVDVTVVGAMDLPRLRIPPPVPAALCAGVACEAGP